MQIKCHIWSIVNYYLAYSSYECNCKSVDEKCSGLELLITKTSFTDPALPITLCEIELGGVRVEKSGAVYSWQSESVMQTGKDQKYLQPCLNLFF